MLSPMIRTMTMALLAALLSVSAVQAQATPPDADRQAAAKELMAAMNVQEQFNKTLASVQTLLSQSLNNQPGGEKAMQMMSKIFDPASPDVKAYLTDAEAALVTFYAERFTTEELKEITKFQQSEPGKKLQAHIPDMIQAMGPPLAKFQESVKNQLMQELTAKPKQ